MGLYLHHERQLTPLGDHLAAILAEPPADPFASEVVAVPTAGVRDWLRQRLALRLGIAANVNMVFPGRFNAAALGEPLDAPGPWELDRLTWVVLAALETGEVEVPGWHDRRDSGSWRGAYATARRIADLFDRYATNRPQLLQQWHAGHDGDGTEDERGGIVPLADEHLWQPRLWRAVRALIGVPNPAERWSELVAGLRAGTVEPQLPERVALFGTSAMSAAQLTIAGALAGQRDVHVFLVHPSPAAWQATPHRLGGRLAPRSAVDATGAARHPLLRSWGRPALESAALMAGLDAPAVETSAEQPAALAASVLHRLQAEIGSNSPPSLAPVEPGDRSVQVHACHGITRQLEVLRDALAHLFVADGGLAPHEVVILCPDLARVAPLIQSVFQRSALPLPVRVTDLSLGTSNPVAGALSTLLAVVGGRCTGPEVLGLCSLEPVRRTFDFTDDDLERIDGWIGELRTTWGLGSDHRARWVPDQITAGTWRSTLDRILLGAAMPAPGPRVGPAGIVPYDDMDAAAVDTAGRLAELVSRLERARVFVSDDHPIEDWILVLTDLVDSFCSVAPSDEQQLTEVLQVLDTVADSIADRAAVGGGATPLSLADVRSLLGGVLGGDRGRLSLRSGAITATTMVPVRNVPFRVVCIVGLEEGVLRGGGIDGDDILATRPCVGERDERVEGRHLMLDALMAAGDHLIITCDGSDITTNRSLPLPVLVNELLDAAVATADRPSIERRHPRQAYDEANFRPGPGGEEPFSFDQAMLAAARTRRAAGPPAPHWLLLAPVNPGIVTLAQLTDSCVRPARTYLGQRLDIRLPRPAEEIETDIPLGIDALDQWKLATERIDMARAGASAGTVATWRHALQQSGALPPGRLAEVVLDDVEDAVATLLTARDDLPDLLAAARTVDVDCAISVPSLEATLRVHEPVVGVAGDCLVRLSYSRINARARIGAALELAALMVTEPHRDWQALVVMRSHQKRPAVRALRPTDPAAAQHLLTVAGELHLRALREPLPLFDRTSEALNETGNVEDEEFERDLAGEDSSRFLWGDLTVDDLLALELRDGEELPGIAGAAAGTGRAVAAARYLWAAYADFVTDADAAEQTK